MKEPQRTVVLLHSAPGTPEVTGVLDLVAPLPALGHTVALMLIQDAVLGALRDSQLEGARQLRALIAVGTDCQYLAEDLAMRGYGSADVAPGCRASSYDDLVDVLLADDTRVIGTF